jgi:FixJ family two-component response regulator
MNADLPKVFIVDDEASIRRSLTRLVCQAGMHAQTFASAEEFLRATTAPLKHPACLVVDLKMPGLGGLELQREMARRSVDCPVIFISGNGDIPSTVQAMKQGAVTFLTKPFDPDGLLHAITEALDQHRARLAGDAKTEEINKRLGQLTAREREVMSWVITGMLNKQIAAELKIAEHTVKIHRGRVFQKMGVPSVAELVRLCAAVGFSPAVPPVARSHTAPV